MRDVLKAALPQFAALTNGHAILASKDEGVVAFADCAKKKLPKAAGAKFAALLFAEEALPKRISSPLDGGTMNVIPLGDLALCIRAPEGEAAFIERLKETITLALPAIAKVAGGEAVLFNKDGKRLVSVNSLGHENAEYMGQVSNKARRSMRTKTTVLGDSSYIVGAKAVRVPLSEEYGLGINNNDSVGHRQKLMDSIYHVGQASTTMKDVVRLFPHLEGIRKTAARLARTDGHLLLLGDDERALDLMAEAIHNAGPSKGQPFVTLNCNTLDQDLLGGILFGFDDGIYKGVIHGANAGAISAAEGGTLVLQNTHDLRRDTQIKLNKAMESGEFFAVGDFKKKKVGARIICLSASNLYEMTENDIFNAKLYYRLVAQSLALPADGEEEGPAAPPPKAARKQGSEPYGRMIHDFEEQLVRDALLKHNGSRKRTAESLGISTISLWRRMKKYGIDEF
ncbi:MAG: sigma 54-interacting transcriptional regulator [Clostridiales Family XIII bacterium]|jgi:transcriptional regulator with PAS, ATPase and Fis domain|nr:sigma 54-interacting transcriptional regulator [Clostridiales Family XIII bacterium]